MRTKEKTTKRTAPPDSSESRSVATIETHPGGSTPYSSELKEAMETQVNSLNTHAVRLTGLIHSEVWALENEYAAAETPDQMTHRLSEQSRESVLKLGEQFLETMRMSIGGTKLLMQMEKGDSV